MIYSAPSLAEDELLSDPTRPADLSLLPWSSEQTINKERAYILSQIYISNKTRNAIINKQKVRVGDWLFNTAEVIKITNNSVYLQIDDHIKIITIAPLIKHIITKH